MTSLCNISDSDLISKLKRIISKDRHLEAELLAHLGEVDARKLYAKEAYSSMFAYCTQVLHFPEYSAYNRIAVARAARAYPTILDRLRLGELHLSGLTVLAPHLTAENHLDLLSRATHKSKRTIEELVADLNPRPAVPSKVQRLPRSTMPQAAPRSRASVRIPLSTAPAAKAPLPQTPAPLGQERFRVQFTAGRETRDKIA